MYLNEDFAGGFTKERKVWLQDNKENNVFVLSVENDRGEKVPVMRVTFNQNLTNPETTPILMEDLLTGRTDYFYSYNETAGQITPSPASNFAKYYFWVNDINMAAEDESFYTLDNIEINTAPEQMQIPARDMGFAENFASFTVADMLAGKGAFSANNSTNTLAVADGKLQINKNGESAVTGLWLNKAFENTHEFSMEVKKSANPGTAPWNAMYVGFRQLDSENPINTSNFITVGDDYVSYFDGGNIGDTALYHKVMLPAADFAGGFTVARKLYIYDNKEENCVIVCADNDKQQKVPLMQLAYTGEKDIVMTNLLTNETATYQNHVNVLVGENWVAQDKANNLMDGRKYYMFFHGITSSQETNYYTLDNVLVDTNPTKPTPPEPVDPNLIASQDFSANVSGADPDWVLEAEGASVVENGRLHVLKNTTTPGHGGIGYKHSLTPYAQPYEFSYDLQSTMPDAANHKWAYLTMRQENPVTNASINANFVIGFRGNQMIVQGTPAGDWLAGATVYPLTGVNFDEETKVIVRDYGTIIKLYAQKSGGELIHIANFLMDENAEKYVGSDTPQVSLVFPRACRTEGYFMIWAHNGASDNIYVDNLMLKKIDMLAPSEPSNPDKFSEDFSQTTNLYANPAAYFRGEVTDGHEIFKVENGKAQAYKKTIDDAVTPIDENVHGAILVDTPLSSGTKNNEFSADVKVNYAANNDRALKAFIGWRKASFTTLPTLHPRLLR